MNYYFCLETYNELNIQSILFFPIFGSPSAIASRPGHFGYQFGLVRVFQVSGSSDRGLEDPFTT